MPDVRPAILLTRPREAAEEFAAACRARTGGDTKIVIAPVLAIRHRQVSVDMTGIRGVIFTSANAVRALARLTRLAGLRAFCVGDSTAKVAAANGMTVVSAHGTAADLLDLVRASAGLGTLLYPHGAVTRGDVAGALVAAGFAVRTVLLYDQVPTELTAEAQRLLADTGPVIAPVFSPRSAQLLGAATRRARAPLAVVSLSPAVAGAWCGPTPALSAIATAPNSAAMLHQIATIHRRLSS